MPKLVRAHSASQKPKITSEQNKHFIFALWKETENQTFSMLHFVLSRLWMSKSRKVVR